MNVWFERIKSFLSTHEEWHTAIIGFCDGFYPFGDNHGISKELEEAIKKEKHYYKWFRISGFVAWVFFAYGIYRMVI